MINTMASFKDLLKDKNKLLMLVPLVLGILFFIVFFGKNTQSVKEAEEVNQSILEPESEGEKKIENKLDAYKKEKEENERRKRELEERIAGDVSLTDCAVCL